MNRIDNGWRYLLLVALPHAFILVLLLLRHPLHQLDGGGLFLWHTLRWLVRLVVLLVTVALWQPALVRSLFRRWGTTWDTLQHQAAGQLWPYVWLGFACYEVVALLLSLTIAWLNAPSGWLFNSELIAALVGIGGFVAAPLPYLGLVWWLGHRDRLLATYTIFPHAALVLPLFSLVLAASPDEQIDPRFIAFTIAPILIAAAISMVFSFAAATDLRWWLLYGGVVLCQFVPVAMGVIWEQNIGIGFLFVPLVLVGLLILAGPILVLAVAQLLWQLMRRTFGVERIAVWRQQISGWQQRYLLPLAAKVSGTENGGQLVEPRENSQNNAGKHLGEQVMSESVDQVTTAEMASTAAAQGPPPTTPPPTARAPQPVGPGLERLYKIALVVVAAAIVVGTVLFTGRAAVYKIHEYERGLHLRGGRFLAIQNPGWHVQIPLVDTVIIVRVNERLGYVEQIAAMTSDNVTMLVSLQYTYRVTDPAQYALQVDDPERIVFEFVQGRLRDVVNTKAMADVMNNRAIMNQEVMEILRDKEDQYGVKFETVQMQSASPPEEVLAAIKDRMVATQRQEQAQAEAAQQRTVAEAELYSAQKRAEANAYEITQIAEAEAEQIRLTTEAKQLAIRSVLNELDGKGELATKYLDYLIAQELKENSKWVFSGEGAPLVDIAQ